MATSKDKRIFLDLSLELLSKAQPTENGDVPPNTVELVRELRLALFPESAPTPAKRGRPPKSKQEEPNPKPKKPATVLDLVNREKTG